MPSGGEARLIERRGVDESYLGGLAKSFDPQADIGFFHPASTHGITEEDWPAFLGFLDNHFG